MRNLQHVNTSFQVRNVNSCDVCSNVAVNLLTNEVEKLDVSFFATNEVNSEGACCRVRANCDVFFFHFFNTYEFASIARNFEFDERIVEISPERIRCIDTVCPRRRISEVVSYVVISATTHIGVNQVVSKSNRAARSVEWRVTSTRVFA